MTEQKRDARLSGSFEAKVIRPPLPKIFIYLTSDEPGFQTAFALAEDGTGLAGHISSNPAWARQAMGITDINSIKHDMYRAYYPKGYQLVDLLDATEEQLASNVEFTKALDLHSLSHDNDTSE